MPPWLQTFDNGVICASEQSVVVVSAALRTLRQAAGGPAPSVLGPGGLDILPLVLLTGRRGWTEVLQGGQAQQAHSAHWP